MVKNMKVIIDQDGCIECGGCEDECPEVFVQESGKKATIKQEYQTDNESLGEITDELEDCVKKAVEICPVDVIETD